MPACGEPSLYAGLLRFRDRCGRCGLDFTRFNVGDGPAAFLTLILGALVVGLAIWLQVKVEPPWWVHVLLWVPFMTAATILSLRAPRRCCSGPNSATPRARGGSTREARAGAIHNAGHAGGGRDDRARPVAVARPSAAEARLPPATGGQSDAPRHPFPARADERLLFRRATGRCAPPVTIRLAGAGAAGFRAIATCGGGATPMMAQLGTTRDPNAHPIWGGA